MRKMLLALAVGLALVAASPAVSGAVGAGATARMVGAVPVSDTSLWWIPTPTELVTVSAGDRTQTGGAPVTELEQIVVTAPMEVMPMRDPVRDVWSGLAAPVWAFLYPAEAWRILLPIPPQ